MKGFQWVGGVLILLTATTWVLSQVDPDSGKVPTIKEIMGKVHMGPTSLLVLVGKELKEGEPNWPEIQKQSKQLVVLVGSLEKNDPPKGGKESWEKLTKSYVDNARNLEAAAKNEDKMAALASRAKLMGSCLACHKAHKASN